MFQKICQKINVQPDKILHIGDSDDYLAAKEAGLKSLLIERYQLGYQQKYHNDVIKKLSEVMSKLVLL